MNRYFVYILASHKGGTLYVGVTSDLEKRMYEHRSGSIEGFTKHYQVKNLVWFDETTDINEAILKEKQIKRWKRAWKIQLIEKENPEWNDLSKNFE